MSYRSIKAQTFHSSLMALVCDHSSEQKKSLVETSAFELDFESITELSINNHSHLMDAFHLPFEFIANKEQASSIANYLMRLLIEKAKRISSQALTFLLLTKTNTGFTPLHQVLKSGDTDNMRAYFAEVRQAVTDPQEYKQLLTGANAAGFTPLHQALKSGNADNMRAYFAEVRQAVTDPQEYKQLLISANAAGFTPLHQAANSGSYEIYEAYMMALIPLGYSVMDEVLFSKTKAGHLPSCQNGKPDSKRINDALNEIRSQFRPDPNNAVVQKRDSDRNSYYKSVRSPSLFGIDDKRDGKPATRQKDERNQLSHGFRKRY